MKYRTEIDGLRALAVVPVIFFHAGFSAFSGGFIGVDVFFVISGFLITSILIEEIKYRKFSLIEFYERRARRIFPALFFVMLVSVPLSIFLMQPQKFKDFSESLVAVSLFSSNILFWWESGYFDGSSEEKPLLHTWSLAVEEQYYLFFPLLLIVSWRFGKRNLIALFFIIALVSFILSEWALYKGGRFSTGSFYLLPTRAWELLVGSLVALKLFDTQKKENRWLTLLGCLLILLPIIFYTKNTEFPGLYAALPVLGSALFIMFYDKTSFVNVIFTARPVVGIGLVSYSAYLWHQPLFSFARLSLYKEPSTIVFLILILLSFILAFLTWKLVEQPFRNRHSFSRRSVAVFSFISLAGFLSIGVYGFYKDGDVPGLSRMSPNITYASLGQKLKVTGSVCEMQPTEAFSFIHECSFGDLNSKRNVVLIGDSHALALSDSLSKLLNESNRKGIFLRLADCEIIPYMVRNKRINESCSDRFEHFLAYLKSYDADVILASRWSFNLYPIANYIVKMPYFDSEGNRELDANFSEFDVLSGDVLKRDYQSKYEAVTLFLEKVSNVSRRLHLVYPIPETGIDIEKTNRLHLRYEGTLLKDISVPLIDYDTRNKFVRQHFDLFIENQNNVSKIDPRSVFCDTYFTGRCAVQANGIPLYYDDDHVSEFGADLIIKELAL